MVSTTFDCHQLDLSRSLLIRGATLVGICCFLTACEPPSRADRIDESEAELQRLLDEIEAEAEASVEAAEGSESASSNWRYAEREDRMRNQTEYTATIRSENTVNFASPYSGSQRMSLQLRRSPAYGNDVIFWIERGQIMCDVYDCMGNIAFDGNTERLTLARSADNSSTVAFARYPEAIANKILASDEVVVELTFYREGTRQFFFETSNLEWDRF